jgi:hypothetical protein
VANDESKLDLTMNRFDTVMERRGQAPGSGRNSFHRPNIGGRDERKNTDSSFATDLDYGE